MYPAAVWERSGADVGLRLWRVCRGGERCPSRADPGGAPEVVVDGGMLEIEWRADGQC